MQSSHEFEHMWPIAPCKGIQIAEFGRFLLVEPGILRFGIWNVAKESGISIKIGIRNPSSTDKENLYQYPESGIRNPWRGIQNPRLSGIPLHGATTKSTWVIRQFSKTWQIRAWTYFSSFVTVFRGMQRVVLKRKKPISEHCVLCPWTFR